MRQVIIYPGEDGFWVAECPGLPGCVSQGETREAAATNIREAIKGYVLALQEDHLPNDASDQQPGDQIHFLAAIEKAREEVCAGEVVPHEQVRGLLSGWLSK